MIPFSLCNIATASGPVVAMMTGGKCFPLAELVLELTGVDMLGLLRAWEMVLPKLKAAADSGPKGAAVSNPQLLAPVLYPSALLAVGANYSGHLKEMGLAVKKWDSMPFFVRPPQTTLVGPGKTVRIPQSTKQFDWECELAIVVGRKLRHASREEAMAGIAGFTIGLDLSCRDLINVDNELHVDLVRGKAQDTMAPCGPGITPAEFVDVSNLRIQLSVNGEQMMDARTSEMLYKCDEILSTISEYITLQPGDICLTGSPSGSAGVHGDRWLKPEDTIRAEIESVGVLEVSMMADD